MGTKRKRLALSCVDCRRRKVKCDRTYPVCVRCQKGGNADNCLYVSHTGEEPGLPTPSDDSSEQHGPTPQVATNGEPYVLAALREMSPHLEVQSRPITEGSTSKDTGRTDQRASYYAKSAPRETYPRNPSFKPSDGPNAGLDDVLGPGYNGRKVYTSDFGKVMVRGSSFSTHYYGPSFAISMLLQFEELSKFVKGMLTQTTSLQSVKERMASTRVTTKLMKKEGTLSTHEALLSMVPSRARTDILVEHYLATIEWTYRVLHVPTFLRDYDAHWHNPEASKPEFVVQLLLVCANMICIAPGGPTGFVGRSSAGREVAGRWILACESWLGEQSQKHITLAHFQTHVLIHLARVVNVIKIKREWASSGQLTRLAMAVGMHREPGLLSRKIGVFDQEMRRRLWFTIVELDLVGTIYRGMPPTVDSFSWDCAPPRNINDEDFDHDTESLPPSKGRTIFTRTSFLSIATESLPLRIEVLSRMNSVRLGLDIDAVMQFDGKLRGVLDDIPKWGDSNSVFFARDLLTLSMYEFVLMLHIPFASQSPNKARFFYSVASKRDIAFKTLQLYSQSSGSGKWVLSDIRSDMCRAALALSHDLIVSHQSEFIPDRQQALALMESMVETLAVRFGKLGQGFHSFWITLSASSLLRWKFQDAEPAQVFAQQAADRVEQLYQQILNTQVPMPLLNGDELSVEAMANGAQENLADSGDASQIQMLGASFPEMEMFNFFDDPFSDMNFELPAVWDANGYNQNFQQLA